MPDYLFVASSQSLYLYNTTGEPGTKPRLSLVIPIESSSSEMSLLSLKYDGYENIGLSVAEYGGRLCQFMTFNLMPALQPAFNLSFSRIPIFVLAIIGMITYQIGKKKGWSGSTDGDLSEKDKNMINSIIEQNRFLDSSNKYGQGNLHEAAEARLRRRHAARESAEGYRASWSEEVGEGFQNNEGEGAHQKKRY
jgi:hypothetical protein